MPEAVRGYALASYESWAIFPDAQQEWERFKAHPDIFHYQAIHLGGDDTRTRFMLRVYTGAQYGFRETVAFSRDMYV